MIDSLASPFKEKIELLLSKIKDAKLPMRLFEARRSFKRSSELFMKGRESRDGVTVVVDPSKVVSNARAGESPHNWGLAVDIVLDRMKPWDTSPEAMKVWHEFGRLVDECDLEWGGKWKFKD